MRIQNILAALITAAMIPPGTIAATAVNGHAITTIGSAGCQGGMHIGQFATSKELDAALQWMAMHGGRFCKHFDERPTVGPYFSGSAGLTP